jgi:hypothetical protein
MVIKRNNINKNRCNNNIFYLGDYKHVINNINYNLKIYIVKNIYFNISLESIKKYDDLGYYIITDLLNINNENKKDVLLINKYIKSNTNIYDIDLTDEEINNLTDIIFNNYLDNYI